MPRNPKNCRSIAPKVEVDGAAVVCQQPAEHPVSEYDRHKAVYKKPHRAIVWNEPGTEPDEEAGEGG